MTGASVTPQVEDLARELCRSEGWDPDERIACEPGETVLARRCPTTLAWSCARWEPYARAAERMLASRVDDWDTF